MNSWKLFGTASAALLTLACNAFGQSCGSPFVASVGDTPVATTAGVTLNLTGICDPGPAGDDMIYNTTWFSFVAPTSESYTVQTCNLVNYDSRLAVLTDCSNPATALACNDDFAGCFMTGGTTAWASKLTFAATEGTTYYIAVGGYNGAAQGSGFMNISVAGGGGGDPACGTVEQSCCVANAGPFCSDADCCNLICASDSFCCTTAWDGICASAAQAQCASCAGGDPNCGTGSNDCCFPGVGPYCTDAACCNAVCAVDSFCCTTEWDAICAGEAGDLCANCAACGTGSQNCCVANDGPYCSDIDCCTIVCALDSFCCDTSWDQACADLASVECVLCNFGLACGKSSNDCCAAATTVGCSDSTCCEAICAADSFCCQTQWDQLCADAALLNCAICDVPCELPTGTAFEVEPCGADSNGGCNDPVGSSEPIALGDIVIGTYWSSTELRDTDWYTLTLTEGTQVTASLYTTAPAFVAFVDINACTIIGAISGTSGCPRSTSVCLPAGNYYIVALMSGFFDSPCGNPDSDYALEVTGVPCDAEAPVNDECDGAIDIYNGVTPFNTTFATTSPLPLDPSCEKGFGLTFEKDIWFTYEATCDEVVTVSTCNDAAFDTRLAAYSDCKGSLVACNDDGLGCAGFTSRMEFAGVTGTTYYLRVGGYATGGTGNITISCGEGGGTAENDECDTASVAVEGANAFDNTLATSGFPNPSTCDGIGFYNDVWFTYTPATSGVATFSTCNAANFDTRLELWIGCPNAPGTVVACNDDFAGCGGFTSQMTADLSCDQKYYVRVGAYSAAGFGTGTLTITPGGTPCATPCPADLNNDGIVDGADLGTLLGAWGPCAGCPADLNNDGVVDGADLGTLLGEWGPCDA